MTKKAFTLAEVLITLAIIGVVAAMTIPTLISNYQEKQTVTRVKAAYSLLNNAVMMAVAENGPVNSWFTGSRTESGQQNYYTFSPMILYKITPYLKTLFTCDNIYDCQPYRYTMKNLIGITDNETNMLNVTGIKLLNGTYIRILSTGTCEQQYEIMDACATIDIDINAQNPPNQLGRDIFRFVINKQGYVLPRKFDPNRCNLTSTSYVNGGACTEWVIKKGNLNYLKCDGLSINGKDTCD